MTDLQQHERITRLLRERPSVAREAEALRLHRAALVGQLRGYATALRLARLAGVVLPLIGRLGSHRDTRPGRAARLVTLLRRLRGRDAR